jgi:hypothetical protein
MKNFFLFLIFSTLLVSCEKKVIVDATHVSITIQNNTSSQPIAIRLTNAGWITVAPKNFVTYEYYEPFVNASLLAFTSDESIDAFNKAKNCNLPGYPYNFSAQSDWESWYRDEKGCTDAQILPPYSLLKEFDFDARRKVEEHEGYSLQYAPITIIAESTDSLISGSVEDRNIKKVQFRVLD